VQRLKTLEKAREAQKDVPKDDQRKDSSNKEDSGKKDGQNKERQSNARKTKEIRQNTEWKSQYGRLARWESRDTALKGVLTKEQEEYG